LEGDTRGEYFLRNYSDEEKTSKSRIGCVPRQRVKDTVVFFGGTFLYEIHMSDRFKQ
jgi:hypothetical protein